ncbi:hypothetical protein [Halomonas sp. NO4]|uniref:hypothetical protein n=1 Tax=Halomonas sp. NO4 TaxID=2484813 RepID=UPI0013D53753|nr:hypothetical protein [Halomonas sp. NO4]
MIRYLSALLLAGAWLAASPAQAEGVEGRDKREVRAVERGERWEERAPRQRRERSFQHRDEAPEQRRSAAGIELIVDGEWLQRWRSLEYPQDQGGPDLCRQRGRITWSTRRLACPDRLPIEGLRRDSTRPEE